jgi:antitoxin VapB
MGIQTTRTFRSGNSEAIRIPKELAFGEGVEVVLERSGDTLRVYPKPKRSVADALKALKELPVPKDTFKRPEWYWPERSTEL